MKEKAKVLAKLGALSLLIALVCLINTSYFLRHSLETDGIVVEEVWFKKCLVPLVEYKVADGKTYRFYEDCPHAESMWVANERVRVLYRPLSPRETALNSPPYEAHINSPYLFWRYLIFWTLLGIVLFLVSAGMYVRHAYLSRRDT
jgi:hypothetical protein